MTCSLKVQMLRAEQVAERVVFVETRPQVQNKAGT